MLRFVWRGICYALLIALCSATLAQFWFFVHVWYWVDHDPQTTAFMDARLERLREKNPKTVLQHHWTPYDRISANLKRAIIAAEDAKLLDHGGFDWEGIQKAHEK